MPVVIFVPFSVAPSLVSCAAVEVTSSLTVTCRLCWSDSNLFSVNGQESKQDVKDWDAEKRHQGYSLLSTTLRYNAFDFVQSAIGTWCAMFGDIATDFACSAALASLGRSPFHGTSVRRAIVVIEAGGRGFPFLCLSRRLTLLFRWLLAGVGHVGHVVKVD